MNTMKLWDPPELSSLTIRQESDGLIVVGHSYTNIDDIMTLLDWLPEDRQLEFYDQFYPSMSDPGAYVCVQKMGDAFIHQVANHGWSSEWNKNSLELIAQWIALNITGNRLKNSSNRELKITKRREQSWPKNNKKKFHSVDFIIVFLLVAFFIFIVWVIMEK